MRPTRFKFKSTKARLQRGASVVESVVASGIVAMSVGYGAQAMQNTTTEQKLAKLHSEMEFSKSLMTDLGRNALRSQWKGSDPCFATGSLKENLTKKTSFVSGDRKTDVTPMSAGYTSAFGASLPADWTTASSACSSATKGDSCLKISMQKTGGSKASVSGFVFMRAVPWDFGANTKIASCDEGMETVPGYGYRMNYALYLETKSPNGDVLFRKSNFHTLFSNVVDGEVDVSMPPVQATWTQGESMLWGWRAAFPLPPKPGPDYDAWPVPYKQDRDENNQQVVVVKTCSGFMGIKTCSTKVVLDWTCDYTLFGSKCGRHKWFK